MTRWLHPLLIILLLGVGTSAAEHVVHPSESRMLILQIDPYANISWRDDLYFTRAYFQKSDCLRTLTGGEIISVCPLCVYQTDGTKNWCATSFFAGYSTIRSDNLLLIAKNYDYISLSRPQYYVYDLNGTLSWSYIPEHGDFSLGAASAGGVGFIAAFSRDRQGVVQKLDADGAVVWETTLSLFGSEWPDVNRNYDWNRYRSPVGGVVTNSEGSIYIWGPTVCEPGDAFSYCSAAVLLDVDGSVVQMYRFGYDDGTSDVLAGDQLTGIWGGTIWNDSLLVLVVNENLVDGSSGIDRSCEIFQLNADGRQSTLYEKSPCRGAFFPEGFAPDIHAVFIESDGGSDDYPMEIWTLTRFDRETFLPEFTTVLEPEIKQWYADSPSVVVDSHNNYFVFHEHGAWISHLRPPLRYYIAKYDASGRKMWVLMDNFDTDLNEAGFYTESRLEGTAIDEYGNVYMSLVQWADIDESAPEPEEDDDDDDSGCGC